MTKSELLESRSQNSRSIDELLLAAIDGDGDEFLNTSKNTTNGVNIVDAEYYYLSNRLGSISAILDADNADRILEYYRYEVFGSATVLPIVDNNTDGLEDTPLDLNDNNNAGPALVSSFGNTYLYTARRFDDITGLYYYRNRYYDPRSGRFITRDPARSPWSNLYGYAMNRASSFIDPLGLYPFGAVPSMFEPQEPYMHPKWGPIDPRSPFERSSDEAAYRRREAKKKAREEAARAKRAAERKKKAEELEAQKCCAQGKKTIEGIIIQKNSVKLTEGSYGHQWIILPDGTSYGFWPEKDNPDLGETLAGVPGKVNQKDGEEQDPYHGAELEGDEKCTAKFLAEGNLEYGDGKGTSCCDATAAQVYSCIKAFSSQFEADWGWPAWGENENCHTFLDQMMEACCMKLGDCVPGGSTKSGEGKK